MIGIQNMLPHTQESDSSYALLAATFEGMPVAVLATDRNGYIQLANPQVCSILGMPCVSLMGRHIDEVLGVWDAKQMKVRALPIDQVTKLDLNLASQEMVLTDVSQESPKRYTVTMGPVKSAKRDIVGIVLTFDALPKAERPERSKHIVPAEQASNGPQSLYVRTGGRYVRVFLSELLWVEAMENYVQLQTTQDKFVVHATLKSMVDALSGKGYQRIHRSFIVKKDEIERIEENQVTVHGTTLPIGKSYRAELLEGLTLI